MQQCQIYNNSLKFSRAIYGILTLIAFLIHNQWLVLGVCILLALGAFSMKLNIPYQFHVLVLKKLFKKRPAPIQKERGELNFVSGMTGALLFICFLFLYFGKFVDFAWILIALLSLFMFLACLAGICIASLMYAFFKKIFKR